jgi:hypothetical protein
LKPKDLPKKIWFLWVTGLDDAPRVVKSCYRSWLRHNPGWELTFLDKDNINQYFSIDIPAYTPVVLSEILRINLLAKYGGVWVDATCFCNKPLDSWIYDHLQKGFFVFERPAPDRMISSWFMAGVPGNYIANRYQLAVNTFWHDNPGLTLIENTRWRRLQKRLEKRDTSVWFGRLITRLLKVHPYFWFHYLFRQLYLADARFKRMWDGVPKISADIPHKPQLLGLLKPIAPGIKAEIDQKTSPVYKLTWKYDQTADIRGTVFDYILSLKS